MRNEKNQHIYQTISDICNRESLLYNKTKAAGTPDKNLRVWIQAFTLIELLVVVLIIGILTAIAVPQYQKAVEKAKATQAITLVKSLAQAQYDYFMANGSYALSFDKLTWSIPWTENTKWSAANSKQSLSNDKYIAEIYSYQRLGVSVGQRTGAYKGSGFFIFLNGQGLGNSKVGELVCAERLSGGIVFPGKPGAFCKEIFQGHLIFQDAGMRIYSLP